MSELPRTLPCRSEQTTTLHAADGDSGTSCGMHLSPSNSSLILRCRQALVSVNAYRSYVCNRNGQPCPARNKTLERSSNGAKIYLKRDNRVGDWRGSGGFYVADRHVGQVHCTSPCCGLFLCTNSLESAGYGSHAAASTQGIHTRTENRHRNTGISACASDGASGSAFDVPASFGPPPG
jgi:hypothetical protein